MIGYIQKLIKGDRIMTEAEKAAHKVKQKYYRDNGGNKCPHCHSDSIEGGQFNTDSNEVSQSMWCMDCEEGWIDHYTFSHFKEDSD